MFARIAIFLALVLFPASLLAQPGPGPVADSLEWMVADSALIVRGQIVSEELDPVDGYAPRWITATFKPVETLKGPQQKEFKFVFALTYGDDLSPISRWAKSGSPLLLFLCESRRLGNRNYARFKYAPRGAWSRSIIELDAAALTPDREGVAGLKRPQAVVTMALEYPKNPDDVLARVRAAIPASQPNATAILLDGPRVNVPEDIRPLAQRWLRSATASDRLLGLNAITPFKSPENIALVKALLNDPTETNYRTKDTGPGFQVHEVVLAARNVLDKWGIDWEPSVPPKAESEMALIPAGDFIMGSADPKAGSKRRRVFAQAFWIGKTDVTVCQFRAFCQASGYKYAWNANRPSIGWKDDHPMVNVTWAEARAFCNWAGGDLPTATQWQKAARGADGRTFPWGNVWDASKLQCWPTSLRGYPTTARVGSFPSGASPFGCLDMLGNVDQWCLDREPKGLKRAVAGSEYEESDPGLGLGFGPGYSWPDFRMDSLGFRIVSTKQLKLASIRRNSVEDAMAPAWQAPKSARGSRFGQESEYDGMRVVAARGKTAYLWEAASGALLQRFAVPSGSITALAFNPQGGNLMTGSRVEGDGRDNPTPDAIRIWQTETGRDLQRFPSLDGAALSSVEFNSKGNEFLVDGNTGRGSSSSHGRLWDIDFNQETFIFPGGHARFTSDGTTVLDYSFMFSPSEPWAAVWDAETHKELFRVEPHPDGGGEISADVSSWGNRLVVCSEGTATMWDFETRKKLVSFGGETDRLFDAKFTADGDRVVAFSLDGSIQEFDAITGIEVRRMKCPKRVHEILLSPDGSKCLAKWGPGSMFGKAEGASLWDLESGKELARLTDPNGIVGFSPDSHTFFAFGKENSGSVWSADTGKLIHRARFAG